MTDRLQLELLEDRTTPALITVTTLDDISGSGFISLREAIEITNLTPGPDEIQFSTDLAGGTIFLTAPLPEVVDDLAITGPGADGLTINGNGSQILTISAGTTAQLSGLTLTGGNAGSGAGGAIFNSGDLTVAESIITGNSAAQGAGIFNGPSGTLTILDTTLSGNLATNSGGGLANEGITGVSGSTFSSNFAGNFGGGASNFGTLQFVNSTLAQNQATTGGGVENFGTLGFVNATVAENSASLFSGGLGTISPILMHNTIVVGNVVMGLPGGPFGGPSTGPTSDDVIGVDPASSHNLIGNPSTGLTITHGVNGNILGDGAGNPLPLSTILEPLADNGGPTLTYALTLDSPAIDAGSAVVAIGLDGLVLTTDQRGEPRSDCHPYDIGAYELAQPDSGGGGGAVDDFVSTVARVPVSGNVLDNDDGDALAVVAIDGDPSLVGIPIVTPEGTLTLHANGAFTFRPSLTFTGTANLTYTIDVTGGTCNGDSTATLSIDVLPTPDGPSVTIMGDVLVIVGTSGHDWVKVRPNGTDGLSVRSNLTNNKWVDFPAVRWIKFELGDGYDVIQMDSQITTPAFVFDTEGGNLIRLGKGDNIVITGNGYHDVRASGGNNEIHLGNGGSHVVTGDGDDTIIAGHGYDRIVTSGGNNFIDVGDGGSQIRTGSGNDTILAGNGYDWIETQAGDNIIDVGHGGSFIQAFAGNNVILAGDGFDVVKTGDGNDFISVGDGGSLVFAGDGNDTVLGGNGSDALHVSGGNNILMGFGGNDILVGGKGNDVLVGGTGSDLIYAGGGQNFLFDGDVVAGPNAAGEDVIDLLAELLAGDTTLGALEASERITIINDTSFDILFGRRGNNVIRAGKGDLRL